MGRKNKQNQPHTSRKGDWVQEDKPLNNPFAALLSRKAELPAQSEPTEAPTEQPAQPDAAPARAVIRTERKGRGGKSVTVVTHLALPPQEAQAWCKELRRQLGCGGQVEGEDLVFHGDQRQRLAELLQARGVRKVTQG